MSKKTFIIITTVSLLVLLGALVTYYFFFSPASENPTGPVAAIKQLFPFGNNNVATSTTTEPTRPLIDDTKPVQNFTQKLRKIWADPVAGAGLTDVAAGTIVRHIEKATGHVYETELFSPSQNRLSNTTIPQVYNAFWVNKNNSVVVEKLSDDEENVNSYTFTLKTGTTTEDNLTGSLLGDSIEDVSVLGDSIFYLQKLSNSSVGYISTVNSGRSKIVWNSPIKELLAQFVNKNTVALTTKPNENVLGYLYFIDTNTSKSKKVLGGVAGLSALVSNDASKIVYLSLGSTPSLWLYDVKTQTQKNLSPMTFPEKCVWSKKDPNIVYCGVPSVSLYRTSLTKWYMGTTALIDDIWKYDLKNNTSSMISGLATESGGEGIDVIKPLLSDNEQYLVFINKNDGSLWSLDLTK